MKIVELTAAIVRIPLRKPIQHASHTRTVTDNIVVKCVLEDGSVGYGEGLPREYVTGDTADGAVELLKHTDWSVQLPDCRDFVHAIAIAEALQMPSIPGDDRRCQGNAARCAIELAVLDAYGRTFGEPLVNVTKLLTPDLYEFKPWVRYSGAITSARGFKARLAAWKMRIYRFRQIKVKVGIAGYDDVARLRSIRRRVGKRMDIRIDANEAWPAASAVDRIKELEPFGITSVEQPISHEESSQLPEIRRRVSTPIMLDESLCGMVDAQRCIQDGLCDLFNIRLSKCGGFIPSLRLVQAAYRAGLGCQLGCMVGESAILSAAGRHFACGVKNLRFLEGSYDRHLVTESFCEKDMTFRWGGWAPALYRPGLGFDVNAAAIQWVTLREEKLLQR